MKKKSKSIQQKQRQEKTARQKMEGEGMVSRVEQAFNNTIANSTTHLELERSLLECGEVVVVQPEEKRLN